MDYEKKYNEALNWMRELYPGLHGATKEDAEHYFPELRESEDERIRKEIINYLDFAESHNLLRAADYKKKKGWVTYLEKQKDAFENGRQLGIMQEQARQELEWLDEKQKEQKPIIAVDSNELLKILPKPAWSEEDELMRTAVIQTLERFGGRGTTGMQIDWLKSLRPRPHWKPSEEQMNHLCAAVDAAIRKHNESVSGYEPARVLKSLYEQLKKLL